MTDLTVTELWRYPVKSMLGERLPSAHIGLHGITGDRAWSLVDVESGANLTARREPELLLASARLAGPTVADGVIITLPDGTETDDDEALSAWLGRPVELRAAAPDRTGTFETQADASETGEWIRWEGPSGSFHDSTRRMVSLVSATTLRDWDRRRFRINVILDGDGEDDLVGRTVGLGGAILDVTRPIDRCVMTTRPQAAHDGEPSLERDLSVLKTINAERATFLGIGAVVPQPGLVTIGDGIRIDDSGADTG